MKLISAPICSSLTVRKVRRVKTDTKIKIKQDLEYPGCVRRLKVM